MGITGAPKTELRPKQQMVTKIVLTMLIQLRERGRADIHGHKQRLATRQAEVSFWLLEVKLMIFDYKLSHKCHSERSEEYRINFSVIDSRQ